MGKFQDLYEQVLDAFSINNTGSSRYNIKLNFIPVLKNGILEKVSLKYGTAEPVSRTSKNFFNLPVVKKLIKKTTHITTVTDVRDESQIEFLAKFGNSFVFTGQHSFERAHGRFLNSFNDEYAKLHRTTKMTPDGPKSVHDALLSNTHNNLHGKEIKLTTEQYIKLLKTAISKTLSHGYIGQNEIHCVGTRTINGNDIYYPVIFKKMSRVFNSSRIFASNDLYLTTVFPIVSPGFENITKTTEKEINDRLALRGYFEFLQESEQQVTVIEIPL